MKWICRVTTFLMESGAACFSLFISPVDYEPNLQSGRVEREGHNVRQVSEGREKQFVQRASQLIRTSFISGPNEGRFSENISIFAVFWPSAIEHIRSIPMNRYLNAYDRMIFIYRSFITCILYIMYGPLEATGFRPIYCRALS